MHCRVIAKNAFIPRIAAGLDVQTARPLAHLELPIESSREQFDHNV